MVLNYAGETHRVAPARPTLTAISDSHHNDVSSIGRNVGRQDRRGNRSADQSWIASSSISSRNRTSWRCLVIRLGTRANLRLRSFLRWPCIHSVLSATIGSVFAARIAGLRVATSRGANRTSRDAR
jgi:hypothetical protein